MDRIPVTLVGGYLGAGKTTLLNTILRCASGVRLAVIVNDFGSINIDAMLIAGGSEDTISLTNGCVCCTMGNSLARTLHMLAAKEGGPGHIVIEASGVADLRRLAGFGGSHPRLASAGIIVVADARAIHGLAHDRYVGDLVRQQLVAADLLVISKTDLIDAQATRQCLAWLAGEVPGTAITDNRDRELLAALVLSRSVVRLRPAFFAAPARSQVDQQGQPFATWSFVGCQPLDGARLRAAIADLPPTVIRAKGIVVLAEAPGQRFVLQRVDRDWSLEPMSCDAGVPPATPAGSSTIVCIGLAGQLESGQLDRLFAGVNGSMTEHER